MGSEWGCRRRTARLVGPCKVHCALSRVVTRPSGGALLRTSGDRYQGSGVGRELRTGRAAPSRPTAELGFLSVNKGRPHIILFPQELRE